MRFPSNFTPTVKILIWIMFAISIVMLVVSALVVGGVPLPRLGLLRGQAVVSLFSSSLVAVFSLLLATVHYKVTDTHLRLNLAFFDLLGGRIRLDQILNIVKKENKLYISYVWVGADPVIAQIAISPKKFAQFKSILTEANPNILYYDEDENETVDSQQQ